MPGESCHRLHLLKNGCGNRSFILIRKNVKNPTEFARLTCPCPSLINNLAFLDTLEQTCK